MCIREENAWERVCWVQIRKTEEEERKRGERRKKGNGKKETVEKAGASIKAWNDCIENGEDRIEEIVKILGNTGKGLRWKKWKEK